MSQTRRLAAIFAADVAGYLRLMGADAEGTLERLKALRGELVDPKIAERRCRIVKTTVSGRLVNFAAPDVLGDRSDPPAWHLPLGDHPPTEELPWLSSTDQEWVMGRAVCGWLGWPH
jgi:class 3 adenylate cyclase